MKDALRILRDFDSYAKELSSGDVKMRCPFRENHTDGSGRSSMYVNAGLNKYHCFSCGAKGRVTTLLTTKFNVSFFDAVEYVSLDLTDEDEFPAYEYKPVSVVEAKKYVPDKILTFEPPKHLLDRGFSKETLKRFRVGFYVDEESGVEVTTIPIYQNGSLVGVKYRVQEPEKAFWYSEGFERRKILYNEGKWASAILVESETDTFRSVQNGKLNTVATLGTELSMQQVKLLEQYEKVYVAYDNDIPGILAKEVAYHLLKNKVDVLFVPYTAEDPGACTKNDWLYAIKQATDYAVYSMEMSTYMGSEYLDVKKRAFDKVCKKA